MQLELGELDHHARNSDPETSKKAAKLGRRGTQRWKIANAFRVMYPEDLNWDQAATIAGVDAKSSPWRRVTELAEAGFIVVSGTSTTSSGAEAQAYRMTQKGLKEMENE